ncbi:MAG: hypothetical protein A2X94_04040 [Bdellovibrionales bacterium GWB1_55_8]|nr:MAG: hypothetical protein A2X94_04040 [Bdellovibrionales bacterium GWB1_55_8]
MTRQQRNRLKSGLLGSLVLASLAAAWPHIGPLGELEQSTLDFRYARFNRDKRMSDRVQVIDIDEESLKLLEPTYGRWPWPRRVYKELIEFLSVGEPAGVFFDVQFGEQQLGSDDDALLAETAAATGIASFALGLFDEARPGAAPAEKMPEDFGERFALDGAGLAGYPLGAQFRNFSLPNRILYSKITKIHSVDAYRDHDGISRRMPLLFSYQGNWIPSLTVAAARAALGAELPPRYDHGQLVFAGEGGKEYRAPIRGDGNLELHFYSRGKWTAPIPIAAAIDSAMKMQRGEVEDPASLALNPLEFKGKVILIGASAAGLEDLKSTPIDSAYPGVLLHATAISNILDQDFLRRPSSLQRWVIALLAILLGYVSTLTIERMSLRVGVPAIAGSAYVAIGFLLFQRYGIAIDLAMPPLLGFAALSHGFAYMSFMEGAERRRMQSTLSKYLSPAVSAQLIAAGSDPRAEIGRTEELSVMFTDIRGFTSLSEKLDARTVVERLNEYLARMTDIVFEHTGTLDKFIGDALMAFWGAPVKDPDHAVRAIRCGLQMRRALAVLNESWLRTGALTQPLGIGMGVHTGEVIVGNIGSERRLDYTVIGDNVNLASRIEGLTKQYHIDFLVGDRTQELASQLFVFRQVDWVKVKGKSQAVAIHEPLCEVSSADTDRMLNLKRSFESALGLYRKGAFLEALAEFETLHRETGDGPSAVYVERCKGLQENPPENWDGIFVAKSK